MIASAPPSGDASVSLKRFTPTTTCSPGLDPPGPVGHRPDQPTLQLLHGLERAAECEHVVELGLGRVDQLGRSPLDDLAAIEDVVVLEDVGLVGQHLLHSQ